MKLNILLKLLKRKEDPRSKPFTEEVTAILWKYGITDKAQSALCSIELYSSTLKYYKRQKHRDATQEETKAFGDDMLRIIAKYGITDPCEQDRLLCEYFDALNATVVEK